MTGTGYTPCACRDCLEIAIGVAGKALCHECEAHGCEAGAEQECASPYAYGANVDECIASGEYSPHTPCAYWERKGLCSVCGGPSPCARRMR
jgi:hypothetical protein